LLSRTTLKLVCFSIAMQRYEYFLNLQAIDPFFFFLGNKKQAFTFFFIREGLFEIREGVFIF